MYFMCYNNVILEIQKSYLKERWYCILKKLIFRIKLGLDKNELEILTHSLKGYIHNATMFNYIDDVEICHDILNKIKRNLKVEYLPDNMVD